MQHDLSTLGHSQLQSILGVKMSLVFSPVMCDRVDRAFCFWTCYCSGPGLGSICHIALNSLIRQFYLHVYTYIAIIGSNLMPFNLDLVCDFGLSHWRHLAWLHLCVNPHLSPVLEKSCHRLRSYAAQFELGQCSYFQAWWMYVNQQFCISCSLYCCLSQIIQPFFGKVVHFCLTLSI